MEFFMERIVLPLLHFILDSRDVLSGMWDRLALMFLSAGLDPVWSIVVCIIIIIILIELIL